MMTREKKYKLILITIISLLPLLFGEYIRYQRSHVSCDSELILNSAKGEVVRVIMTYRFGSSEGSYNATGTYFHEGKTIEINDDFLFNYYLKSDHLILISREDKSKPSELEEANSISPDFFNYSGRGIIMRLSKENSAGYLFSIDNTPIFYCKRNKA
ncbi:hypothetical protein RHD99_19135 [Buttiauxella selenatireducens]|uniref:FidL-like membrane protein n=1 Tax=Buttiauxella selenatireducens TaxID=3073902 RepID=A0ABY9S7Z2_9ENTR|nr:hypothetical protein [Buttiauxella sp. R73]WMY73542.1 hypothetical protein RHD99_19135 [Buttiauxella sp. R73]